MTLRRWTVRAFATLSVLSITLPIVADDLPDVSLTPREVHVLEKICAECHARPGIGAPLIGVEAEWEPRRAAGFERLLLHTIEGYRGMPPLGTCSFCTETELRRLVRILSGMPSEAGR